MCKYSYNLRKVDNKYDQLFALKSLSLKFHTLINCNESIFQLLQFDILLNLDLDLVRRYSFQLFPFHQEFGNYTARIGLLCNMT